MSHGGDIYSNKVNIDFSVSLNPFVREAFDGSFDDALKETAKRAFKRAGTYPDLKLVSLRESIAKAEGVSAEMIVPGNGASEVLMSAIRSTDPKNVLLPVPCFTGYEHILKGIKDCKVGRYFINEPFDTGEDLADFISGSEEKIDLLILTDPGNPIGKNIDENVLIKLLKEAAKRNIKVILDESFYYLSEKGFSDKAGRVRELTDEYENLIIIRSYTKLFALPGIRMGCSISGKVLADKINDNLPEWNISVINEEIMSSLCVWADDDFIKSSIELIRGERNRLFEELKKRCEKVYPSDSVYITLKGKTDLYDKMLDKGILIRDLGDVPGLEKGYYRVAVKKREENETLLKAMDEVM
ncbi:MAG TPA: hypothetical protein DCG85_01760 [Lachnospiraceae bacterium]|nr:hypothetical protein [Lachnospiraceae bacterium]